jgi:hypothetical protein
MTFQGAQVDRDLLAVVRRGRPEILELDAGDAHLRRDGLDADDVPIGLIRVVREDDRLREPRAEARRVGVDRTPRRVTAP